MRHLGVMCLLLFSACAPKTETLSASSPDSLRSSMRWQSSTPWWSTDLDTGLTDQVIHWVLPYDQECESAVQLDGQGNMKSVFSIQLSEPQTSDANCSRFDGDWTYSVQGSALTLCQQGEPCITLTP